MSTQPHRTATARAGQHISNNMWLWIAVFTVATVALGVARWIVGGGEHLGDLLALSAMVLGSLMILKSQADHASPNAATDVDDSELLPS